MLQQTRVAVVVPYYERFLERFPDVGALARAPQDAVLAAWSGLGYYGRARSLHAGAIAVMERHRGRVPEDARELEALPGIGRYTAGAIASVAFGHAEPILDGNVRRVLSRLFALSRARAGDAHLWSLAARLVIGPSPGDLNQALMELGATVCSPRAPRCGACPVARFCRARACGDPEAFPPQRPSKPATRTRVAVALVVRRGSVLLEHPRFGNPLRGTWDLPAVELAPGADPQTALEEALALRGVRARVGAQMARTTHTILNRRLHVEVFACPPSSGWRIRDASSRWMAPRHLADTPVSGATKKILGSSLDRGIHRAQWRQNQRFSSMDSSVKT
jgi:A/G-specific adenine glycosylase